MSNNLEEIGSKNNESGRKFKEEPREMAITENEEADEGDNREMMLKDAEQQQKGGTSDSTLPSTERMVGLIFEGDIHRKKAELILLCSVLSINNQLKAIQ
jgi:hypothetical protein